MKKTNKLPKPSTFYGHKPEDIIRAFFRVNSKKVKERLKKEQKWLKKGGSNEKKKNKPT